MCFWLQAYKCENSKNEFSFSFSQGYVFNVRKFQYEVLSIIDLKDGFHLLRLTGESKEYCGILPHLGGAFLYQRMLMGLNISPAIWQSYRNVILDCLQSRKYCEAFMDDCFYLPQIEGPIETN